MTKRHDISNAIIAKYSKQGLIQKANKHPESLKGFLTKHIKETYSVSDKDIDEIINEVTNYYNL